MKSIHTAIEKKNMHLVDWLHEARQMEEGVAIATGLKKAREYFDKESQENRDVKSEFKIRSKKK